MSVAGAPLPADGGQAPGQDAPAPVAMVGVRPVESWWFGSWCGLPVKGLMVWMAMLPAAWLLITLMPFAGWVTRTLGTLCHEMGHAAAALMVGRPALPIFDLTYGGGVTPIGERMWFLLLVYAVATVVLARRWLEYPARLIAFGGLWAVMALLIFTGWEETVFIEMGFGGQVIAGGVFLYRALTGEAEIYPGERWIYGLVGWCVLGQAAGMCWDVLYDAGFRAFYLGGKGGIDNDFVRLADDHWIPLDSITGWNLALSIVTPALVAGIALALPRVRYLINLTTAR